MRVSFKTFPKKVFALLLAALSLAIALSWQESILSRSSLSGEPKTPPLFPHNPESIYAADPDDSWNRIFHLLFSRQVTARLSDEFPKGAPFVPFDGGMLRFRVSSRTFQRFERGDHSIDPLYPAFFNDAGVRNILSDPDFSNLQKALNEAINDNTSRTVVARALMQSDLWAAHDILFSLNYSGPKDRVLSQRKEVMLPLFARLIRKLALTTEEVQTLPENYQSAAPAENLPELFAANGPWIEVRLSPHRLHDLSAGYRRTARVFLKPSASGIDKWRLLERLRSEEPFQLIDSVALVTQLNLIDNGGTVQPTQLTSELQVRTFTKDQTGKVIRTDLRQCELSRRSLLSNPSEGGLVEIPSDARLYFPVAGNDFGFASTQFTSRRNDYPVLVTMRRRCEGCHGAGATAIFTLSHHFAPPLPTIALLPPGENVHGWYVAGRKQEREEFKALWQRMTRN